MEASADLERFYDDAYRAPAAEAERLGAWRALGARAKADHIAELCARAGLAPGRILEVGCGDGSLLSELAVRKLAPRLAGVDISEPAVGLVRSRAIPGLEWAETFDGARLPARAGEFDLGVLSHVLEHVPDPVALLRETARACSAVLVEVPLERNLSARRASKRMSAQEIGHIQALDRPALRALVAGAGLRIEEELVDPLTREVHAFFADTPGARLRAAIKAGVRRALFTLAPRAVEGLLTVHYACLCVPGPSPPGAPVPERVRTGSQA